MYLIDSVSFHTCVFFHRSGTEEEYSVKEALLQEVSDVMQTAQETDEKP